MAAKSPSRLRESLSEHSPHVNCLGSYGNRGLCDDETLRVSNHLTPITRRFESIHSRTKTARRWKERDAPTGIRTPVIAVRGQYDWPDYTIGAHSSERIRLYPGWTYNDCASPSPCPGYARKRSFPGRCGSSPMPECPERNSRTKSGSMEFSEHTATPDWYRSWGGGEFPFGVIDSLL